MLRLPSQLFQVTKVMMVKLLQVILIYQGVRTDKVIVSDDIAMNQTTSRVRRRAATKALQRLTEWTDTLRRESRLRDRCSLSRMHA